MGKFFVFVQTVHHLSSAVAPVNAYIIHTDVTGAVTVVTAVTNAAAVSYKVTCVLLKLQ